MNTRFSHQAWMLLIILLGGSGALLLSSCVSRKGSGQAPGTTLTVFAAASTIDALQEITQAYARTHPVHFRLNFASSGTLAQQMAAGAKADVFLSADEKWMDYAAAHNLIVPGSRRNLLANTLVLIAPTGKSFTVKMDRSFDFAHALHGRLAVGDPDSVPAGRYAKQALISLHWYDGIQQRVLSCVDVRAALTVVEQGEVAAGIVYASDAKLSKRVTIIGEFPAETHTPVCYPAALGKLSSPAASSFLAYLTGPEAVAIFTKYGFTVMPPKNT